MRKKLTDLEVFRYNFRERLWVKCGSAEEAEATQRLAEQEDERRRLVREEEHRVEAEKREAYWEAHRKQEQEAGRKKAEADQIVIALRDRKFPVEYLCAPDEGHGFAKKSNADFQFQATVLFLKANLLD